LDAARWLRVEPIYTEPVILALPKTHALAGRSRLTLASLADESFVSIPRVTAPEMFDDIIASCRSAGFSPRIVQEAAGWHTLASLVGAGVGVGVVPRSIAEFQQAAVVYRGVRGLDVEMSLAAVWKRSERSPVRERFVTALKAVAGARADGVASRASSTAGRSA
jgi:DNA-binding transcriptional LysR family regulator